MPPVTTAMTKTSQKRAETVEASATATRGYSFEELSVLSWCWGAPLSFLMAIDNCPRMQRRNGAEDTPSSTEGAYSHAKEKQDKGAPEPGG